MFLGTWGPLCPSPSCLDRPHCGLNVSPQGPASIAAATILGSCGLLEGEGPCGRDPGCWGRCRKVVTASISALLSLPGLLLCGHCFASHSLHHEVTWTCCDFPTSYTEATL